MLSEDVRQNSTNEKVIIKQQWSTSYSRDSTVAVSGTVAARNNVGSVRSWNIFCSGGGTC